jgi:hypothetical protein
VRIEPITDKRFRAGLMEVAHLQISRGNGVEYARDCCELGVGGRIADLTKSLETPAALYAANKDWADKLVDAAIANALGLEEEIKKALDVF